MNRFNNNFWPGELLVRRNDDGSRSPVLVLGVVNVFCVPEEWLYLVGSKAVLLTYLMWDGFTSPYEVCKLKDEPLLEGTVYERLEMH